MVLYSTLVLSFFSLMTLISWAANARQARKFRQQAEKFESARVHVPPVPLYPLTRSEILGGRKEVMRAHANYIESLHGQAAGRRQQARLMARLFALCSSLLAVLALLQYFIIA